MYSNPFHLMMTRPSLPLCNILLVMLNSPWYKCEVHSEHRYVVVVIHLKSFLFLIIIEYSTPDILEWSVLYQLFGELLRIKIHVESDVFLIGWEYIRTELTIQYSSE